VAVTVSTVTNQNCIHEEIMVRFNSDNCCYHSSRLLPLSKNLKIKIYRTIILRVVFYGCQT
jgi:hypothetical protein